EHWLVSDGNTIYGELEVGLNRAQPGLYEVELRLTDPSSDADRPPQRGPTTISPDALLPFLTDPVEYGKTLTSQLFRDPQVLAFYGNIKTAFERTGRVLRLRLLIGPSAPELHGLRWELLLDPETNSPLATSTWILFSRFMLSSDWRVVKL